MTPEEVSPAMKQFVFFKQKYPDCLILFRMGDFYETFYDDAKLASKILNITLTKRGTKHPAPLEGIPHHALEQYLAKLIRAGIKCAICEQMEDPKFAKGVVKRDVIRVVTPGTIIDNGLIPDKRNNYLMSLFFSGNDKMQGLKLGQAQNESSANVGISFVDLSTGEFCTSEISQDKLMTEINRINPAEIIFSSSESGSTAMADIKKQNFYTNEYEERFYFHEIAESTLKEHFGVLSLEGFGLEGKRLAISSSGALISYLQETQKTSLTHINKIKFFSTSEFMVIDRSTLRNLEIVSNIHDGSERYTLLEALDRTYTPMGSRLLRTWITNPLLDTKAIGKRLDGVDFLFRNILARQELKECLEKVKDIERLISRINYGNANARDLLALSSSLEALPLLKDALNESDNLMIKRIHYLPDISSVPLQISSAIKDEPPQAVNEGGMIRKGYNLELDDLHNICVNGRDVIKNIEEKERQRTGIKSLKVGFNRVFGYFIEVTKPNLHMIPKNEDGSLVYIRKQTTANGERFVTEELKHYEEKILGAEEKITALELELFRAVCADIVKKTAQIQEVSNYIAEIDVLLSFADVASEFNYTRPHVDSKFSLKLEGSRHPVIERIEDVYIPNDIFINQDNQLMIITGPNMAGKSTLMRQVALCVLMAQIGCFVPAKKAEIGVVDRIFTRVGAHDDLTHGQSTFMVEMNETATILNNATPQSLIIMDEIGRGTSTFDGVSIAWSVAEYIISKIKAKTLFATHYHVLTKLDKFEGVKNYHIAVKESRDELIFLRKLIEGGTDKSFGVHVAKLAGMPKEVIEKAKEIQYKLEVADNMRDKIIVEKTQKKDNSKKEKDNEEDEIEFTKLRQKRLVDL